MIASATTLLPQAAQPATPKQGKTAHVRQPALALPLAVSTQGGSGHTVVAASLPAQYYTGNLYLAPWGNDANSCTFQLPCQTITGIQGKVSSSTPVILLRGGIYRPYSTASSAATLYPATTSSTAITYAAYPGEVPIITGAVPITGWTPASGTGNCARGAASIPTCWQATLPSGTYNFDYLLYVPTGWPPSYIPYVMSRRTQSVNTPTGYNINVTACGTANKCVEVNASDLIPAFCSGTSCMPHNANDVKFYNFHGETVDALQLASASYNNPASGLTSLSFVTGSAVGFPNQARYLIVNSEEYFTANATPGTFYIDCPSPGCVPTPPSTSPYAISSGTIYYIAQAGENPPTDLILAPQAQTILSATGTTGTPFQNVTLQGIAFVGDNFQAVPGGYVSYDGQPNISTAVSFVDTQNVTVDSSVVAHTSGWGLEFTNDYYVFPFPGGCAGGASCPVYQISANNQLTNSVLFDIGTSALRLGRYPPDVVMGAGEDNGNTSTLATQFTLVRNNLFSGTGRMYPGGEDGCILINSSYRNTIQYNECVDSYGGGIGIGPYTKVTLDFEYNNTVQYNLFHDLGRGVIADFGCVHFANQGGVAGNAPPPSSNGDYFLNNICHDITSALDLYGPNGGTGIYFDNDTQYATAKNNLVYRTIGALFFNNYSPDCNGTFGPCNNTVSNNILAYSYTGAIKRGGKITMTTAEGDFFADSTFTNNIVYFDQESLSNGQYQSNGPQYLGTSGKNFWTCYGAQFSQYGAPCTSFFPFNSNDYWNPHLSSGSSVNFYTTDSTGSLNPMYTFTTSSWQKPLYPNPGEDILSLYQDPGFQGPRFPSDNYDCGLSCPTSVFTPFPLTGIGRSNPLIFPRPTPPTFPLQLISPYLF